jgi:YHS domain-containing protein
VTLRRFQPTASSPRRDYRGRIYLFPAEESAAEFDADPHRYAVPVYKLM